MQIWSGLQGSGTRSDASNTPPSAIRRRRPDRVERWMAGSKPSLRPASWTGWKTTPRTHDQPSAWSTIAGDLVVVDALADSADQGGRDAGRLEPLERLAPDPRQAGRRAAPSAPRRAANRTGDRPRSPARSRPAARRSPASWAIRTPLVLIIRWRIGRARAAATISQNKRVDGRLAAGQLDQVGLALGLDHRVEHRLDLGQRPVAALADRANRRSRPGRSGCRPR